MAAVLPLKEYHLTLILHDVADAYKVGKNSRGFTAINSIILCLSTCSANLLLLYLHFFYNYNFEII